MSTEPDNLVEQLHNNGITRVELNAFLYKWLQLQSQQRQKDALLKKTFIGRLRLWARNHYYKFLHCTVAGKALSLLQSQFAKKPKNPV